MSLFCSIKLASDVRRSEPKRGNTTNPAQKSEAVMPRLTFYAPMMVSNDPKKINTNIGPSMMDSLVASMKPRFP